MFDISTVFQLTKAKQAVAGMAAPEARKTLAEGYRASKWGWDAMTDFAATEALRTEAKANPPPPKLRHANLTRRKRWEEFPDQAPLLPTGRFVLAKSLDPTLDWRLTDGADRCLDLMLSLAGNDPGFVTYTVSLAWLMGRTTRTIQNYYRELVEAGYIHHSFCPFTKEVTILVLGASRHVFQPTAKTDSAIKQTYLSRRDWRLFGRPKKPNHTPGWAKNKYKFENNSVGANAPHKE